MKLNSWLFQSCAARCRWFDVLLIRALAASLGLLGIFYSYFWVRWLILPFVPHPRAWLDPYLVIGIPLGIFAAGLFRLLRVFVLTTTVLALLAALFFSFGLIRRGYATIPAQFALLSLLMAARFGFVSLPK